MHLSAENGKNYVGKGDNSLKVYGLSFFSRDFVRFEYNFLALGYIFIIFCLVMHSHAEYGKNDVGKGDNPLIIYGLSFFLGFVCFEYNFLSFGYIFIIFCKMFFCYKHYVSDLLNVLKKTAQGR